MSIVALKRNSRRYQARISGIGSHGFSLNGGLRNIGAVGQTNLGRSVTRTPFRGTEPMGHGGTNGTYVKNICNSGSCCTNNPDIIKPSNKNTKGLIDSTIKYPTSVYNESCSSCQPIWMRNVTKDTSALNYSQGSHIQKVIGKVARCADDKSLDGSVQEPGTNINACSSGCDAGSYHIGGKKITKCFYSKTIPSATSAENYMRTSLLKKNCLPTPPNKKPFPMTLNHNGGCFVNFLTPEEAKAAGQLPNDWMVNNN